MTFPSYRKPGHDQDTSKMKLLHALVLVGVVYTMGVFSQAPVQVVEVPGLFGKYGGYILGIIILFVSYFQNLDDNVVRISLGGDTMTMSSNGGPTPTG